MFKSYSLARSVEYAGVLRRILRLYLNLAGQQFSLSGTGGGNGNAYLPWMIFQGLFSFSSVILR